MAYIESHQTLLAHPKTKRAARLLGIPRVYVIGHLHALWYYAMDYAQDGDVSGFDAAELSDAAEWPGDPDQFIDALTTAGFLDLTEDGRLVIHDWYDYAGKLIERRKANAERMRDARAKQAPSSNTGRALHVRDTCETRAGANVPNLTVTEQTKPERNNPRARARERPATPAADKPPRSDSVFESIATACYGGWASLTKDERGRCNAAAASLRATGMTDEELAAEIPRRHSRYRTLYPDLPDASPNALAGNWTKLGNLNGHGHDEPTPAERRADADAERARVFAAAGLIPDAGRPGGDPATQRAAG